MSKDITTSIDKARVEVFNYLKTKGIKQKEIADVIGVSVGYVSNVATQRRFFSDEHIEKLAGKWPEVRKIFVSIISNDIDSDQPLILSDVTAHYRIHEPEESTIPYVPAKARAGYIQQRKDAQYLESLPYFVTPMDQRYDVPMRIFEAIGNSMEPTIFHGDLVYGRLTSINKLKKDYVHVVVPRDNSHEIVIKRVNRSGSKLVCTSDNKDDSESYRTYMIDVEDVAEVYHVYGKFTRQFPKPSEMYDRVLELETEVHVLKEDLQNMDELEAEIQRLKDDFKQLIDRMR